MTKNDKNWINAIFYATENIATLVFGLISIVLIARVFGPTDLGRYSVAQSVSNIFLVFSTLGFEYFIIRELSRNYQNKVFASSVFWGMVSGWFVYFLLVLTYYWIFLDISQDFILLISLGVSNFLTKVIFIKSYYQAINKPRLIALGSLLSRVLSIIFLVYGSFNNFSFNQMMMYLPLQAVVCFLVMAIGKTSFFQIINYKFFNLKCFFRSLKESSPVIASSFLYFCYSQSDVLIISRILGAESVGVYSAAIKLIPQASFIGFALVSTFYHKVEIEYSRNHEEFEKNSRLLLSILYFIAFLGVIFIQIFGAMVIEFLYGNKYIHSRDVLLISCFSWIFMLPAIYFSRLLILSGLARYEFIKMVIVSPAVLAANFYVTEYFGILGTAAVFVSGYFIVDFLIYFVFKETRFIAFLGFKSVCDIFFRPLSTFNSAVVFFKTKSLSVEENR